MSSRKIRVGAWELHHHVLKPTRCLLQRHAARLQAAMTPPQDALITFTLNHHPPTPHAPPPADAPTTISIHRSLLIDAGGPLCALVSGPFSETRLTNIPIHECFDTFDIIRRFLYCEPIRMLDLPLDTPLVADRWGLRVLFEAFFSHAEERVHSYAQVERLSAGELVSRYLPIMAIVEAPQRFKSYLALRLGVEIKHVNDYFKQQGCQRVGSLDDVCCVEHEEGVTCRRRKAVCLGKDGPAYVQAGSISGQSVGGADVSLCHSHASPPSTSAQGEAVAQPGASPASVESPTQSSTEIRLAEVEDSVPEIEDSNTFLVVDPVDVVDQVAIEASAEESRCVVSEVVNVPNGSESLLVDDSEREDGAANVTTNVRDDETSSLDTTLEEEVSDTVLEEVPVDDEDESNTDDAELCIYPQKAEWHDKFNIWKVFQFQKMLDQVVHYMSHYGPEDYTPLLLDAILRQLEPNLSDDEIINLLREIDWGLEYPNGSLLNSNSVDMWSSRAWRLLATAKVGHSGEGSNILMSWNYVELFQDMHARAAELENKITESDSDSSHSSAADQDFDVDWNGKAGVGDLEFSMSLQCDDLDLERISSLYLRIKLIEKADAPLDKAEMQRSVSVGIKVIESGCGCGLRAEDGNKYQGFTPQRFLTRPDIERQDLGSFRIAGVPFDIMSNTELGVWMKRHKRQCGLMFQVRIYVFPREDDDKEEKKEGDSDMNGNKCKCGFCDCDYCSSEDEC